MGVAATIVRRPEPTNRTTFGITAIEIPHSTRFTLLLLLLFERWAYMWYNHVATLLPNFTSSRRPSTVDSSHRHAGSYLLQPQCCVALKATMLRRPHRRTVVEPPTLSIIAIEITHSTGFTFLLLLRIQRYMWRNHGLRLGLISVTGIRI